MWNYDSGSNIAGWVDTTATHISSAPELKERRGTSSSIWSYSNGGFNEKKNGSRIPAGVHLDERLRTLIMLFFSKQGCIVKFARFTTNVLLVATKDRTRFLSLCAFWRILNPRLVESADETDGWMVGMLFLSCIVKILRYPIERSIAIEPNREASEVYAMFREIYSCSVGDDQENNPARLWAAFAFSECNITVPDNESSSSTEEDVMPIGQILEGKEEESDPDELASL